MKNVFKKAFKTINGHLKPTKLENTYIPRNGVGHGDLKRFWDNYDVQLANRISEIKHKNN